MSLAAIEFGQPCARHAGGSSARHDSTRARIARYAALVTSRVRVSLGNQRADRPQGWVVAASAVGGLVGGLLLAHALGRSLAPDGSAPSAPGTTITTGAEPAVAPASASSTVGTAVPPGPIASAEPPAAEPSPAAQGAQTDMPEGQAGSAATSTASELAVDPTAVPPVAAVPSEVPTIAATAIPPASPGRELVKGQIAYLRCEGVPLQDGPFPCPRDRRLEKQVWSALERLQQCAVPASNGGVELRVEFRTRGRHTFELRSSAGSETFDTAAHACLAGDMELVRTSLRPLLMTVLFRFELR